MFAGLKSTTALIPTGNSAITHVPSHWRPRSMRSLLTARSERGRIDLPLLSVARERGVFVRTAQDANRNVIPDDLTNYKVALTGDLVINKMKAWQGSLGLAPEDGIVSPAYYVYDFRIENRDFGQALLRSSPYIALLGASSDGVRVGQWDLNVSRFRDMTVFLPPVDEQVAIVKFLAHAHARIDRAIAAKRRFIVLQQEQTNAIVQQIVTRGLDPSVSLRDSGIQWLGQVPEHWQTVRMSSLLTTRSERRRSDLPLLSVARERGVFVRSPDDANRNFVPDDLSSYKVAKASDLVINKMKAWQGSLGIAPVDGIVSPAYYVYGFAVHEGEFGRRLLKTQTYVDQLRAASDGIRPGQWDLSLVRFKNLPVLLPPADEQKAIVTHLTAIERIAANTRQRAVAEIDLLRELRVRLTSDVVTGQVDVREVAAQLPELSPVAGLFLRDDFEREEEDDDDDETGDEEADQW